MRVNDPERARQNPAEVTELAVTAEWDGRWQDLVPALSALRSLSLGPGVDLDPAGVASWPAALRHLSLAGEELAAVLPRWVAATPSLASIELRSTREGSLDIPDAVADFPALSRLAIKAQACTLPEALSRGALRELVLALEPGEVPAGLCALARLERLRLAQRIERLPDAFERLAGLRHLDLTASLNRGSMSADIEPPSRFRPMPAVIARLPALRTLILDRCGIFERDLLALAGHPHLHHLSIAFAGAGDLSPLRELPALRELNLKGCGRVRDLSPLSGLPLTWLGLDECSGLRDLGPLLDLPALRGLSLASCDEAPRGPVLVHPTLEELSGDDATLAQWERRDALAGMSPEGIRAGLAAGDPAVVRAALDQLATWVALTSAPELNAIFPLLHLGDDAREAEAPFPVEPLSRALAMPGVDGALAARVFSACFRSVEDNLRPAIEAAEIVRDRGSDADQVALVDAFLFARRGEDPGHRSFGEDVQELLIGQVLPRLRAPALAHLLAELSDEDLSADELEELFVPAYAQAAEPELDALDARLRSYVAKRPPSTAARLGGAIAERRPDVRDRLSDLAPPEPPAEQRPRWDDRLRAAETPEQALAALEAFVAAHDAGEVAPDVVREAAPWVEVAVRQAGELPAALARRLFELSLRADVEGWLGPAVLGPLVRDQLDWLASLDDAGRRLAEKRLGFWQRSELEPEGLDLTAARARLSGVSEDEMWQRALAEAIDFGLASDVGALERALERFAARPVPFTFTRSRSRALAGQLDTLRVTRKPETIVRLMATLRRLRPRLTWAPEDQQYPLTYLLPIALERGPGFFAEHVAPWLAGEEIGDARFAYNLACYLATHGDTAALCGAIRRALALGKPAEQFLVDPDFSARLAEPEVDALLRAGAQRRRYYAMDRVSYYDAPCRFIDDGWRPDRPAWWEHDWQGGTPVAPEPEVPIRIDLEPFNEHAEVMSRALPLIHLGSVPLMHRAVVEVLEANGAKLQKFPAVLVDPDDGQEHGDYYAVNVLGVLAPRALGEFHGRVADLGHVTGTGFGSTRRFDEPLDGLVLAWIEDTHTLVVFESLRDALKDAGFDEIEFHDLSHIAI